MRYTAKDLTIDEKLRLLMGVGGWSTYDAEGKLYEMRVSDGPVGLRKPRQDEEGKWHDLLSVAYPSSQLMSQTWRPELARKTGEMIADDCIDNDVDVLLAPGVNIKRNPLCGRNFEYFSEDPFVSGVFGREYIDGVQSREVGATLKHFCCNNAEYSRFFMSSEVDERTLREIYLEPFRLAAQAKPWATMCAYNPVNGTRMSEHKKLYTVLRDEFGFDGLIMSDWEAVQNHAASIRAGLDLEMPGYWRSHENLKKAYENGEVSDEEIDACIERMLAFVYRAEEASKTRKSKTTVEERLAASQEVAERGVVLLKNDGVLPLPSDVRASITGDHAKNYTAGGGSSRVQPIGTPVSLADALKEIMTEAEITYQPLRSWDSYPKGPIIHRAVNIAYDMDVAIVCVGQSDREEIDRESMKLPINQERLIIDTAKQNENTVVVIFAGAPIDMSAWIDDVAAVVWAGYPGERGGYAVANILAGKVNPSGRLTESFPMTLEDNPTFGQFYDAQRCVYSEGLLVGYRWYDTAQLFGKKPEVRFPFGYGLSYSDVQFTDLETASAEDGGFDVTVELENVSNVDGSELVQVYIHEVHPVVFRPEKELKAFKMVDVKAGETVKTTLHLTPRDFAYYSTGIDAWTVNPGLYEIIVSRDAECEEFIETVEME